MTAQNGKRMFPCPVCAEPTEVRTTKKDKPCMTCHPCGIQLFIRGPAGIEEFNRLAEQVNLNGLISRMQEIEDRYRLVCPECGCKFWIEPSLIKTSSFDGSLKGFRCPKKDCGAIVPWKTKE
jgi:hypothetical protein